VEAAARRSQTLAAFLLFNPIKGQTGAVLLSLRRAA
jgi:hypothetical protein